VERIPVFFRFGNVPIVRPGTRFDRYDIVHLHYPFYVGAEMVLLAARRTGAKYVVTYHQDVLPRGPLAAIARFHHKIVGSRVLEAASKILVTSLDYASNSRLERMLSERPDSFIELPNGVDTTTFSPERKPIDLFARHKVQHDGAVVLFVGALDKSHYFKGLGVLIRALAQQRDDNTTLVIVGDGDLRKTYANQAKKLGLGRRVTFVGRVEEKDLPSYYTASDFLVLPSVTRGEAFGLVLLEAMASGRPVVASNLPGVRSIITPGMNGLLCRPGDAQDLAAKIRAMLDDEHQRTMMGENARRRARERYDWSILIPRLSAIYREVL
jgi:glycosyltransferase involved in cell wall biosynthesis